jgi:hypothetical protein
MKGARRALALTLLGVLILSSGMTLAEEGYTRLHYVPYEELPLTLEQSSEAVEAYCQKHGIDLSSRYLASVGIRNDGRGVFWEHTYLLKRPSLHNYMWIRVYDATNVQVIRER